MTRSRVVPDMTMMHDPVHGPVTLEGWHGAPSDVLVLLTRSAELARLRRIKQLGLAAFAFPAADHSRFAHALGTAHVMRRLLEGRAGLALEKIDPKELARRFPGLSAAIDGEADTPRVVANHFLAAAMLQDIGELPYAHATWRLLRPGPDVRALVHDRLGRDAQIGGAKEYFTAGLICQSELLAERGDVDVPFLLYLLFGSGSARSDIPVPGEIDRLRHLLDGVVDADRLDYVYRDAHHTFGHIGGPQAVVDSLLDVDDDGPVFREPGPVLDFVSTRSSVWSRVYFEAQNRFRITLLRAIVRAVREDDAARRVFFGRNNGGELSLDEFLRMDDASVQAGLESLSRDEDVGAAWRRTAPGRNAAAALRLYLEASAAYEAEWLPPSDDHQIDGRGGDLPEDLFFDTCADYRHHRLYDRGSIRVAGPRFRRYGLPMPLEDCAGPLHGVLQVTWFPLAVRGSVLLFLPESRLGASWEAFTADVEAGSAHRRLMSLDDEQRLAAPDTREHPGFQGPAIFVCHAFDDRDFVRRVLRELATRRRRYHALESPYQDSGMTATENSLAAVRQAEAVLVVLSANFHQRFADNVDGTLAKEVREMCSRHAAEGLPIVFVSADDHDAVAGAFPWSEIGLTDPAMVEPLRDADDESLSRWIERCLKQIDGPG